jgi:hypothetical protein
MCQCPGAQTGGVRLSVLLLVVRHLPLVLLVLLVLLMLLLMPLPLVLLLLLLMLLREMHHGSSGGAARGWRALPPRHVTRGVGGGWGFEDASLVVPPRACSRRTAASSGTATSSPARPPSGGLQLLLALCPCFD